MCFSIDIAKDRRDLLPLKSVRTRNKRKRRNDDFALQSECANRDLESDSRVTHRNAMLGAREFCYALLELIHVLAAVRQPASIEDVVYAFSKALPVADVWLAQVQRVFEGRCSAKDCQIYDRGPICYPVHFKLGCTTPGSRLYKLTSLACRSSISNDTALSCL